MPVPVIALGGIDNWKIAGSNNRLAGALRVFAKNRSSVEIVFDFPTKEATREEIQAKELATYLKKYGAKDVTHGVLPSIAGSSDDGLVACVDLCRRYPAKAQRISKRYAADVLKPEGQDPYGPAQYTRLTRSADLVTPGEINVDELEMLVKMAHADGRKAVVAIQAAMGIGKTE